MQNNWHCKCCKALLAENEIEWCTHCSEQLQFENCKDCGKTWDIDDMQMCACCWDFRGKVVYICPDGTQCNDKHWSECEHAVYLEAEF